MPLNGVINFYKPPGMSSAQAVAFVKRLVGGKVGHAGTLDPEAAGVLPILLGKATRLCDELMGRPKQYLAEIAFGTATDTQDSQGIIVESCGQMPSLDRVAEALPLFLGEISQIPPQYSALKVGGKAAYQLAREGLTAQLTARKVRIDRIDLLGTASSQSMMLRIRCGKGTYIRTLCHDLGQAVGCPAHMRFLLREESGGLQLSDAAYPRLIKQWRDSGMEGGFPWFLMPETVLANYPDVHVHPSHWQLAFNGAKIPKEAVLPSAQTETGIKARLYANQRFLGLYEFDGQLYRLLVMLLDQE